MTLDNINVTKIIEKSKKMLKDNKKIPPTFALLVFSLLKILEILLSRVGKNSSNSSIPPSQDPNRQKQNRSQNKEKKPGGQKGREGKNLKPIETPDEIVAVPVDKKTLPKGHVYTKIGVAKRQVVEIHLSRHVVEYQLEIVRDEKGRRFTAKGPKGTERPIQYGASTKAMAVYMSQYQLIPYGRVEEYFRDQVTIPISVGSLFNFNKEAFDRLESFELIAKEKLRNSKFLHSDETGININGKGHWLHAALNDKWTLFVPHAKRGIEAINDIDILPQFKGISIHDHWKPYFTYKQCEHALCNAHHLRELEAVIDLHPSHTWAQLMSDFLKKVNRAVDEAGGVLPKEESDKFREQYREILKKGDEECPLPIPPPQIKGKSKKRGRLKKTKERNLIERLRKFENEVLRFMEVPYVTFTNNSAENEIRMTKVQQKISGCFKSFEGAKIFCRVRSYILTAQKHGINATEALNILFSGKLPDFCNS